MKFLSRQSAMEDFNANRKQRKTDRNFTPRLNNQVISSSHSRSRSNSPNISSLHQPLDNRVFVTNLSLSTEVPKSSNKQSKEYRNNFNNLPIEPSEDLMNSFFPEMEVLDPRHERIFYQTNEHRMVSSNINSNVHNRRSRSRSPIIKNAVTQLNKTVASISKKSDKPLTMAEKLKKKMEDAINKRQEKDQQSHIRK